MTTPNSDILEVAADARLEGRHHDARALELEACGQLQHGVESLAEFITRVTPKHAPIPWHLEQIIDVLEATRHGEVYATISMPPRHGKTVTLAHGLAYRTLYDPACLNFYATYGDDLSQKTSRNVRRLAREAGVMLASDAQNIHAWRTVAGGGLVATSVGGSVVGMGCNSGLIVADDIVKGREQAESKLFRDRAWDWLRDDLMSRLEAGASLIVNATRYHEDDPIGRIMRDGMGLPWRHIVLPAVLGRDGKATDERTDPDARALWADGGFDLEKLATIRARGEHGWWSLYQQSPVPKGGRLFKRDWFNVVDVSRRGGVVVRGWDLAATADSSAAATAGAKIRLVDGRVIIEDIVWIQGTPAEVEQLIVSTAARDGREVIQDLPQDPGQAGKSQKTYLGSKLHGYRVYFSPETGSKELRAEPLAAQAQMENVDMLRANWNDAALDEIESFPVGRLKDRVDALSRAYARAVVESAVVPVAPSFSYVVR